MNEVVKWIDQYDLFLLDLDGLLVNTENIHYEAYRKMCADRGFTLDWDFPHYCKIAHLTVEGLQKGIYQDVSGLKEQESNWAVLYQEKKNAYLDLLNNSQISLMPGAKRFLHCLQEKKKKRCVVTHSARELVDGICKKNDTLNTIPNWIVREDYDQPKPSSDCYQMAIDRFGENGDVVIGFEDTPKGMNALMPTGAQAVIITSMHYPELAALIEKGAFHYPSLDALPEGKL